MHVLICIFLLRILRALCTLACIVRFVMRLRGVRVCAPVGVWEKAEHDVKPASLLRARVPWPKGILMTPRSNEGNFSYRPTPRTHSGPIRSLPTDARHSNGRLGRSLQG